MDPQIFFLFFLLILSGFFSGAEIALVSLSEAKVRALLQEGHHAAKIIEELKSNPQRLLITILIGNNLVNIGASVFATAWATTKFGSHSLGIVTGVLTFLVLIFGEIYPKTMAERYASRFALFVAYPLLFLQKILYPVVWILEKKMNFLMRHVKGGVDRITEDEIKAMVSVGAEEGAIDEEEREIIANVLDFADTRASLVMTPREKICDMNYSTRLDDAITIFLESGYSRIPIYNGDPDSIVGILTIQELLRAKRNRETDTLVGDLDLNDPILVPESKLLYDLFKEFQWKRQHIAIVVNEHGSVSGLVTLEDLLEEIVGDINDESDRDECFIEKLSHNSWRVDAEVYIEDLNEALETQFDCDEHKRVSYLLLEKFQKIPRRGEDIIIQGFHFFIERMKGNKIDSVRIVKI